MSSLIILTLCHGSVQAISSIAVDGKEAATSFMETEWFETASEGGSSIDEYMVDLNAQPAADEAEAIPAYAFSTQYAQTLMQDHHGDAGAALVAFMLQHQESLAKEEAKRVRRRQKWEKGWARRREKRRAQKEAGEVESFHISSSEESSDSVASSEDSPVFEEDALMIFQDLMSVCTAVDLQKLKEVADDATVTFLVSRMNRDSTQETKHLLQRLIDAGFNLNAVDPYGFKESALHSLVYNGAHDSAVLLNAQGATKQPDEYLRILDGADGKVYFARHQYTVDWFRDSEHSVNKAICDLIKMLEDGDSPRDFLNVFMDLVDMGADLRWLRRKSGSSAIGWVARCIFKHQDTVHEQVYLIERMVEAGFDINYRLEGETALSRCLYSDAFNEDAMRKVIQLGADVNQIGGYQRYYLNTAASQYGHLAAAEVLLENGADLKLAFDALTARGRCDDVTEVRNLCGFAKRQLKKELDSELKCNVRVLQNCLPLTEDVCGHIAPHVEQVQQRLQARIQYWATIIRQTREAFDTDKWKSSSEEAAIEFLRNFEQELLNTEI